ncbi:ribosomal subunit interface protein [Streptomyces microflavus]|uniref:Ribosome hibernation promoting factor n=1 Tax=Streptomyces microflavus TaxID=1919 RepID=A0A7J0CPD0_STRMI|nr:ribosomal subunit interface protein [Streptomyces microflavus]GGX41478.1 ribosomal subunit interface protein [Streptomyces microflavus]SCK51522.1 SSU ribosomal protein S30P [Streptomyces sp. ScaeMP-e48]
MDRQRSSRWVVTSPTGEEEAKVTESEAPGDHRGLVQKGDAPPLKRGDPGTEFCVDIVVKGRKTEVPERFRKHVAEKLKLDKIQKFDGKVISLDVEVSKEPNPRQADRSDRVEITLRSRGPVIRAEAAAGDPYAALDLATGKLEARLRKQHDKRYSRRGNGRLSAAEVGDVVPGVASFDEDGELVGEQPSEPVPTTKVGSIEVQGEGPLVMREKTHTAAPMALDQALYEMELVGHDFYLFVDSETKEPSVVYRRHAYDYGVIHLRTDPLAADEAGGAGGALGG